MRWDGKMKGIFFFSFCNLIFLLVCLYFLFQLIFFKKKKRRRKKNTYAISQNPFSQIGWIDRPVHSTEEDWIEKSIQEYICFIISIPPFIYTIYIYRVRSFNSLKIEWIQKIFLNYYCGYYIKKGILKVHLSIKIAPGNISKYF